MAALTIRLILFFVFVPVFNQGQNLLSCDTNSPDALGYRCNGLQDQCGTFAMFHINSNFSSLSNLTLYMGLDKKLVSEASGFSTNTEFLPINQPLLIPIDCRCNKGGFFEALLTKTTIKGESFYGIAELLEGLTTCKAIQGKNPSLSPWGLQEMVRLLIPLRCACPSQTELKQGQKFLVSYPINEGDTVSDLASEFHTSIDAMLFSNNKSVSFTPERLESLSTILIPFNSKPVLTSFSDPREPKTGMPSTSSSEHHSRRSKLRKVGLYIALSSIIVGVCTVVFVVIWVYRLKNKKPVFYKSDDVELQHLRVRTRSEIKTMSEDSLDRFDTQAMDTTTPHKLVVETYTVEDLKKATEDFNSSNLIEGSVYHGRLNGKNLAIKRIHTETISKIEFELFQEAYHSHPSFSRLLGTCLIDGPDSYLVFEYAKNGSLKDWIHGGLAMKSQFIASCYCFLSWNQRLKICLDVARSLEYMHHIMNPGYVHRNIKSRNIFLDDDFNANVGNFGMARCNEDKVRDAKTLPVHSLSWNRGYLAPEYLQNGTISSGIDIFSYGVVLLEVLSGQPPIIRDDKKGEGIVLLSDKFKSMRFDDFEVLRDWMDTALGDAYSFDMAVTLAYLARSCVEEEPSCRPSSREIVEKLSKMVKELSGEQSISRTSSSKPQTKVPVTVSNA
ncbi:Lysm receptor kinase [Thalictrum thalictroides]|uniref:Lysm receptor kinase n=1 Tax=Thalictrum thalictroides TaxID=46969 RepID=A0A7J6X9S9_THATH|nr:Lysm receptor kinase [Thalictrum thalictroides]